MSKKQLSSTEEDERDYRDVVVTATSIGANIIWLGFGNISYPLLKYIKQYSNIPVVVDTDSVWSRFILRGCPFARNKLEFARIETEGLAKEHEEHWGTCLADVTTAVSEVDAEYYRRITDEPSRVHLFTNVIDLDMYRATPAPFGFRKPCIYLAGTFWPGSPMEDAARWMLAHVFPLVKREFSDIHFYIAGRGSNRVLADIEDANITVTGELPSVLPYLINASLTVVPLRFESGTRFKILEAGACEIPVISTTLGAEGILVTDGVNILIADTPQDFAAAIVRVLNNSELAKGLGKNLKSLVYNSYSISTLAKQGGEILDFLFSEKTNFLEAP